MADFGIRARHPGGAGTPHILGFLVPRDAGDDPLLELWNGPSEAARVLRVNEDGQVQLAAGTVGAPALAFELDKDTGLYRVGPDQLGIAVGGVKVVEADADGVSVDGELRVDGQGYINRLDRGNVSGSVTIDWSQSAVQRIRLTGSVTLTLSNPRAGAVYLLEVEQGTAGTASLSWPTSTRWPNAESSTSAGAVSTTQGRRDLFTLYYSGTHYLCSANKDYAV